jgi:uncharacterized Fe-S cluster protein YjdI
MKDALQTYAGDGITVTFDPKVCTHSARCVKGLSAVFDVKKRPWVKLDGASADEIEAQVARCPSGALKSSRP